MRDQDQVTVILTLFVVLMLGTLVINQMLGIKAAGSVWVEEESEAQYPTEGIVWKETLATYVNAQSLDRIEQAYLDWGYPLGTRMNYETFLPVDEEYVVETRERVDYSRIRLKSS